jgi:prephenate dehydrogenase
MLGKMNLKPSQVTTAGFQAILNVIGQTYNDSWELFEDLERFNPYTWEMLKELKSRFLEIQQKIQNRTIEE